MQGCILRKSKVQIKRSSSASSLFSVSQVSAGKLDLIGGNQLKQNMMMNFIKNPKDYFKNFKGVKIASNSISCVTNSDLVLEITQNQKGFNPGTKGIKF